MIEVNAIAGANGTASCSAKQLAQPPAAKRRGVSKREAWRDVLVIPSPVRLLAIRLSRQVEGDRIGKAQSLLHGQPALSHPRVDAGGGLNLNPVDLIGWLQQAVAQARGQRQVGASSPCV